MITKKFKPNPILNNASSCLVENSYSEFSKYTTRGQVRVFTVDGKPVAYILNKQGYRTKDVVSPACVRMVMNWFARSGSTYVGKVPQTELEYLSTVKS
jgi:hypothetical protein